MPDAHELWSAAQLAPGEGIADGVARIEALLALPAPAGEPEMPALPEPVFTLWRRADGTLMGYKKLMAEGPWLTVQEAKAYARAYGDARAEHARRVATPTDEQIIRAWNAWPRQSVCSRAGAVEFVRIAIRAAAPPQGETR